MNINFEIPKLLLDGAYALFLAWAILYIAASSQTPRRHK